MERPQYEPYLVEAREVVELFKTVELQDYFQDDCVEATRTRVAKLEGIAPGVVAKQCLAVVKPNVAPSEAGSAGHGSVSPIDGP